MTKSIENRMRKLADKEGFRLVKARSIRWEGTRFTPPYRLIDHQTGWSAVEFDDIEELRDWLEADDWGA